MERDRVAKKKLPGREDILERMWKLANARVEDAVRLACWPEEEPGGWRSWSWTGSPNLSGGEWGH